jgi:hypothetical protein
MADTFSKPRYGDICSKMSLEMREQTLIGRYLPYIQFKFNSLWIKMKRPTFLKRKFEQDI